MSGITRGVAARIQEIELSAIYAQTLIYRLLESNRQLSEMPWNAVLAMDDSGFYAASAGPSDHEEWFGALSCLCFHYMLHFILMCYLVDLIRTSKKKKQEYLKILSQWSSTRNEKASIPKDFLPRREIQKPQEPEELQEPQENQESEEQRNQRKQWNQRNKRN